MQCVLWHMVLSKNGGKSSGKLLLLRFGFGQVAAQGGVVGLDLGLRAGGADDDGGTGSSGRFPWGGRELYLEDGCVTSSYIVPAQTLFQQETHPYTVPAHTQDAAQIPL